MRRTLPIVLSAAFLAAACTSNTADTTPPSDDGATSSAEATTSQSSTDARIIDMNIDDWSFAPNTITAKQGEKLIVRLHGIAGRHSLAIQDLGINVPIEPGETKDVEIPTDKAGSFGFRCLVPCGSGHRDMKGTLVIE